LFAREIQELRGERARTLRCIQEASQVLGSSRASCHGREQELARVDDDGEQLVEVVRDTAGQTAQALQAMGLPLCEFLLARTRHVGDDDEETRSPAGAARERGDVHFEAQRMPRGDLEGYLVPHATFLERGARYLFRQEHRERTWRKAERALIGAVGMHDLSP